MAFGEFMKKITNPSLQIGANAERARQFMASVSSNGLPENLQNVRNELVSRPRPVPSSKKWFR